MTRVTLWVDGHSHGINVDPQTPLLQALSSEPGVKSPRFKMAGKSRQSLQIADVVLGTKPYLLDVSIPGMMHGRVLQPLTAGAVPLAINEDSLRAIPGARAVHIDNFLAVVAASEWDAIRAANTLKVTWSQSPVGRVPVAAGIASTVETDSEFSNQSHARTAPSCAVCDYRGDTATVWFGSQKPHATAQGIASLLKLPLENVRAIWVSGPGSHGHHDAGNAAMDAALLSKAVGRPVRVRGGSAKIQGRGDSHSIAG